MDFRISKLIRAGMLAATALAVAGMIGCKSNTNGSGSESRAESETVSGKVTFKGDNVPMGYVLFMGEKAQYGFGYISSDGKYTATDVPRGNVSVVVFSGMTALNDLESAVKMLDETQSQMKSKGPGGGMKRSDFKHLPPEG